MPTSKRDALLKKALLQRRLARFVENSRYGALPSLVSIAILLIVFGPYVSWPWRLLWGGGFVAILALRLVGAHHPAFQGDSLERLMLRHRWAEAMLGAGALAWSVSLPLAAALAGRAEVATFTVLGATVLAGVLLMHRSLPGAARFHVITVGAGFAWGAWLIDGLSSWPTILMTAVSVICVYIAVGGYEKHFREASEDDFERERAETTIRMLLNDHEAQGSDWLWNLDAGGRIEDPSVAFSAAFGLSPEALDGEELVSLLDAGRFRDRFAEILRSGSTFRDILVAVTIDGERKLWRVSGHPRGDGRISGLGRDVTHQEDIEERVRSMAFVDPLTGLANRHFFNQRLREIVTAAEGQGRGSVLMSFDLDGFRQVNDALGHIAGDSVLREIGQRLRRHSRAEDVVARMGGDEFMVLIDSPGGDGMLIERAHRMLAAIREPLHIDGQMMPLTACVGLCRAANGTDPGEALRRVDLALHAAKGKGRDTMALYDDGLDRRARERRATEVDLRRAIEHDQLAVHYQPVIALPGGETIGYEALVRWHHPERGLLLPEHFIGIAEESGLIAPLGDWVIAKALREVSRWPGEFRLALNLSPSQIRNPRLVASIEAALATTRFPANRVEFEITEQVLMADVKAGRLMLERLRALGAVIALDDFGTGYASLSYLREFRFERVKIDRTFVADLHRTDESAAIVSATTRLAQALGMKTTAEGVETQEQLDLVRRLGCDEVQGFLIHPPVAGDEIAAARAAGRGYPGAQAEGLSAIFSRQGTG